MVQRRRVLGLTNDRLEAVRRSSEDLSQEFHTNFSASGDELVMTDPLAGAPPPGRGPQVLAEPLLTFPKGRTREYRYRDHRKAAGWPRGHQRR